MGSSLLSQIAGELTIDSGIFWHMNALQGKGIFMLFRLLMVLGILSLALCVTACKEEPQFEVQKQLIKSWVEICEDPTVEDFFSLVPGH